MAVGFSPGGRTVAAANHLGPWVKLYEVATGNEQAALAVTTTYPAVLAFSLRKARGEAMVRGAATLLAFTAAMLVISLYFFVISSLVIGVACPLCLSLDAVNIALFGVSVAIVRVLRASAPPGSGPEGGSSWDG